MGVIKMDKEYLDLICDNEGEEEVKIAKDFEDEWIDINEEAWELQVKRRMKLCIKIKTLQTTKDKEEQRGSRDDECC